MADEHGVLCVVRWLGLGSGVALKVEGVTAANGRRCGSRMEDYQICMGAQKIITPTMKIADAREI
jgi:hypothetical protein